MIVIVAALGQQGQIGLDGGIPWRVPEDLKHFRQLTLDKTIVVGRKTYESMPKLDRRRVIVVTSGDEIEGVETVKDPLGAIKIAPDLIVCGGAKVYEAFLPVADRMVLSRIGYAGAADTYFPIFDPKDWVAVTKVLDGFMLEQYSRRAV